MPKTFDVAVVGAGPAGSATAALLSARGFRVVLVERSAFPRPKPCAEYLSPQAARVLDRLGVLAKLDGVPQARLTGMHVVSPNGTRFTGRFVGRHGFRGYRDHGLALRRELLDSHLAAAAVGHGAVLRDATVVERLGPGGRHDRTLTVRTAGHPATIAARVVVGADGLNSRVAAQLRLTRRGTRRRVALVAHATHVAGMRETGEMHVSPIGYVGLAPVGGGLTNVAVVADLARVPKQCVRREFFHHVVHQRGELSDRLRRATWIDPIRAVGPFARWTARATADRAILVGDAADFCDPFTGEGIYAALRGAELAADHLAACLEQDRLTATDLAPYDGARHCEFGKKWVVERLVSWAVAHPTLFDHVAARFAADQSLADLFVGVTGDFVPAGHVLRLSYLWKLIR